MTTSSEIGDDVGRALAIVDRQRRFAVVASLTGYVVWLAATVRFIQMAEQSSLAPDVVSLLRFGALVVLFGGFATQFMVCHYVNVVARRILRAIHVAQPGS